MLKSDRTATLAGWLVVLRIYVASAAFQLYRDLEAGDNQSLKFKWRDRESNRGPLAPQAKSLTTRLLARVLLSSIYERVYDCSFVSVLC